MNEFEELMNKIIRNIDNQPVVLNLKIVLPWKQNKREFVEAMIAKLREIADVTEEHIDEVCA